jgi:hypothetical protein
MSHASQLSGIAASPLVVATAVGTCATSRTDCGSSASWFIADSGGTLRDA